MALGESGISKLSRLAAGVFVLDLGAEITVAVDLALLSAAPAIFMRWTCLLLLLRVGTLVAGSCAPHHKGNSRYATKIIRICGSGLIVEGVEC